MSRGALERAAFSRLFSGIRSAGPRAPGAGCNRADPEDLSARVSSDLTLRASPEACYEQGLDHLRAARHYEAHDELEIAWRVAPPEERSFLQGLVHVAVAWHHARHGNRSGCERQLEKAARRLAAYAPNHRGVDVADVLGQVAVARSLSAGGSLAFEPLRI